LELPGALGAGLNVVPRCSIRGRLRLKQEIEKNGLAVFADHGEPSQLHLRRQRAIALRVHF